MDEVNDESVVAAVQASSVGRRRGRPRGSAKQARSALRLDPLDYLLQVINDPTAKNERRDRLALAALPYVNAKVYERNAMTKKQKTAKVVAKAVNGDDAGEWGDDLRPRS